MAKYLHKEAWEGISNEDSDESNENLLSKQTEWSSYDSQRGKRHVLTVLNAFFFCASIVALGLSYRFKKTMAKDFLTNTTWYSPVLKDVDLSYHDAQFSGTLFPPKEETLGRMVPSHETDVLWEDIEVQRPFVLTKEDVIALGKDPEYVAKYEDSMWGFGDEAYIGTLDVFHVLHCLHALQEEAWNDYGKEGTVRGNRTELHWYHLRHCTDILYQNIRCNANTDVITYQWMEQQRWPFPDFSINKKCRNFDDVVRWRNEHGVDGEKYKLIPKPEGLKQVPAPLEFYRLYASQLDKAKKIEHSTE
ncbi:hypothetical protein MMC25_002927 [Agyrium rufum]|nr:hypothetical protein [Agyrium rufum]